MERRGMIEAAEVLTTHVHRSLDERLEHWAAQIGRIRANCNAITSKIDGWHGDALYGEAGDEDKPYPGVLFVIQEDLDALEATVESLAHRLGTLIPKSSKK